MSHTIQLLLSTLVTLFAISASLFSVPVSSTLVNQTLVESFGTIDYSREPVFETDFEDIIKVDVHHLNLSIDHRFNFEGEGGATFWVEGLDRTSGPTPHSGNRCIGMELTDISLVRRNEFNILNLGALAGDDITVSVWLYLPSDWGLHAPNINWNWYEIVNPFAQITSPWYPYLAVHINEHGMGGGSGIFDVDVKQRDINGELETLGEIIDFPLPRGRWFNVKFHLIRDDVDSSIKVWFDGTLICDVSVIPLPLSGSDYKIHVAKIYHETSDTTAHRIWVDDLKIWSGTP